VLDGAREVASGTPPLPFIVEGQPPRAVVIEARSSGASLSHVRELRIARPFAAP